MAEANSAEILLVSCVKGKLARPAPARDLYTSALFAAQRQYADSSGLPWYVLSAEYGLLAADEWVSPYERLLSHTPPSYRIVWAQWVVARLELLQGPLAGRTIEIHAGETYLKPIRDLLDYAGATVLEPLHGLRVGQRLAWYADRREIGGTARPSRAE